MLHLHKRKLFTFGQLLHVWKSLLADIADEEEILKRAFQFFDKDGNGDISVQELITTMHELGDLLTEKEIMVRTGFRKAFPSGYSGYCSKWQFHGVGDCATGIAAKRQLKCHKLDARGCLANAASLMSQSALVYVSVIASHAYITHSHVVFVDVQPY